MDGGSVSIEPVRSDADVAAASALARGFFAYMRATYPAQAPTIDAYLADQGFEALPLYRSLGFLPEGERPAFAARDPDTVCLRRPL